ncbi:hypothetical protein AB4Z52_34365 [Rhizobium sp. 2YAF20]|uniref:hypothetical protein n=1 Tax=Rhizobium sp. 2YAF20 TaxID=3233027 RepID=UPI003F9A637F
MATDQPLRDHYRLKWIPVGLTAEQMEAYRGYLDMTEDERSVIGKTVTNEELELLLELETARAMYVEPEDRQPGSITEAKVARYPERYNWK